MEQGHKPDELVSQEQIDRGDAMLRRLVEWLRERALGLSNADDAPARPAESSGVTGVAAAYQIGAIGVAHIDNKIQNGIVV